MTQMIQWIVTSLLPMLNKDDMITALHCWKAYIHTYIHIYMTHGCPLERSKDPNFPAPISCPNRSYLWDTQARRAIDPMNASITAYFIFIGRPLF